MKSRLLRIFTIVLSFFFLTGFVPFSIIGPSLTVITSGNIYKAGAQLIINQHIKKETGKDSFTLIKEEINKNLIEDQKTNQVASFNEELRHLVEKRISITRKKIEYQNLQKLLTKQIKMTRLILNQDKITQ